MSSSAADERLCGAVPDQLVEALRSGRAIEQGQEVARRISGLASEQFESFIDSTSRWLAPKLPVEDGEEVSHRAQVAPDDSGLGLGLAASSSSREMHRGSQAADIGAELITKYLFSDEGKEKGTVKVYIEAKKLQLEAFSDAQVDFSERTLSVRADSHDGRTWLFHANLYGAIKPAESKYTLSNSGHKVSVTLKKADAGEVWHRFMAMENGSTGKPQQRPGITHVSEFV